MSTTSLFVERILSELGRRSGVYLVGIGGVPGSGKSTLARALASEIPGAVVVPMDGYHLPRAKLDAEGLRRRGAPWTFDRELFRADMEGLRRNRRGIFPEFDHGKKDPEVGVIEVFRETPVVLVEGLYVLMGNWGVEAMFDWRIFVDCEFEEAVRRLTRRHMESGLGSSLEVAGERARGSDWQNAEIILEDGCRERADMVLRSGEEGRESGDSGEETI